MLLELDGGGPRYAQITRALLSQIHSGVLSPGARVPGTRELARELACSRNVVLLAYEQLVLEGYLVGRTKAGTFVSAELPRVSGTHASTPGEQPRSLSLSPRGRALADLAAEARPVIAPARDLAITDSGRDPRPRGSLRRGASPSTIAQPAEQHATSPPQVSRGVASCMRFREQAEPPPILQPALVLGSTARRESREKARRRVGNAHGRTLVQVVRQKRI